MGKDKKKFAKVYGRLDLDTEVITLTVKRAGHYNLPGCHGTGGLCYSCCRFRGVEGGEGCRYRDWWKYALHTNRKVLSEEINKKSQQWENRKVLVDVTLDPKAPAALQPTPQNIWSMFIDCYFL